MKNNHKQTNTKGMVICMALLLNVIILKAAYLNNPKWYWWLVISVPLTIVAGIMRRESSMVSGE